MKADRTAGGEMGVNGVERIPIRSQKRTRSARKLSLQITVGEIGTYTTKSQKKNFGNFRMKSVCSLVRKGKMD